MAKKKNPQDQTKRNNDARKKVEATLLRRIRAGEHVVRQLTRRVAHIETALYRISLRRGPFDVDDIRVSTRR